MTAVAAATRAADGAALAAAHARLRGEGRIQFDLPAADPPPKIPGWWHTVAEWLRWIGRPIGRALGWLFEWIPDAPYARILLWLVLAAAALLVIGLVIERLRTGSWRLPRWRRGAVAMASDEVEEGWRPDAAPARALLREADALAAAGRFAEAAHLLLQRSVEDIARRRPHAIRPALTSRDIAASPELPSTARPTFAAIARVVERSLFGGRAVDAEGWAACRQAYADFALPKAWA